MEKRQLKTLGLHEIHRHLIYNTELARTAKLLKDEQKQNNLNKK